MTDSQLYWAAACQYDGVAWRDAEQGNLGWRPIHFSPGNPWVAKYERAVEEWRAMTQVGYQLDNILREVQSGGDSKALVLSSI